MPCQSERERCEEAYAAWEQAKEKCEIAVDVQSYVTTPSFFDGALEEYTVLGFQASICTEVLEGASDPVFQANLASEIADCKKIVETFKEIQDYLDYAEDCASELKELEQTLNEARIEYLYCLGAELISGHLCDADEDYELEFEIDESADDLLNEINEMKSEIESELAEAEEILEEMEGILADMEDQPDQDEESESDWV